MTRIGEIRDRYATAHPEDPRPSRFDGSDAYTEWATCADAWALRTAARISITLPTDPQSGRRKDDPLLALIPGDGIAMPFILRATEIVTGIRITRGIDGIANTAPAARAALRRWAMKHEQ